MKFAGDENDEDEIRSKFTNRGYKIDDKGNIKANTGDLYSDRNSREGSKAFGGKKDARLGGRNPVKKEFKTPEYLKRKSFNGANENAREGGMFAREGGSRASETGQSFEKKESWFGQQKSRLGNQQFGENKSFTRTSNRQGSRAIANAPVADGLRRTAGFLDESNTKMSVSDVKKMLNPNAYANAKGL